MLSLNRKVKVESEPLSFDHVKASLTSLLLFLILLFLPTQWGLHTWPFFTFVSGQRIDYLSPTFYLTDTFIFFLFVLHIKEFLSSIRLPYILFFLFLAINISFSQNALAGWWMFLKLIEFCFLAWSIANKSHNLVTLLLYTFTIGITFESLLAVFQFFHEGSLGGIFYYFGERYYAASTPGIANASIGGTLVLRPYGTFSHPNVLAGYLLIGLLFLSIYTFPSKHIKQNYLLLFPLLCGTIGIFLTLSRTAILLWVFIIPVILFRRYHTSKKWLAFGFISFCIFLGGILSVPLIRGRFFSLLTGGEDISVRIQLLHVALSMIQKRPVFGVGLQNFIFLLPSYIKQTSFLNLQPVHNIFFLVASETGITGLVIFLFFLLRAFWRVMKAYTKNTQLSLWVIVSLIIVCLIGQVDHYFITLQQGQLLFTLIFGASYYSDYSLMIQ